MINAIELRFIGVCTFLVGASVAFYSADTAKSEMRFCVWIVVGVLLALAAAFVGTRKGGAE